VVDEAGLVEPSLGGGDLSGVRAAAGRCRRSAAVLLEPIEPERGGQPLGHRPVAGALRSIAGAALGRRWRCASSDIGARRAFTDERRLAWRDLLVSRTLLRLRRISLLIA
jgi:hypothetical protein